MKRDDYYEELEKDGYYETIDKRSKDYREYKKWKSQKGYNSLKENIEKQPKGVGDTVEKITKATGIKKVVKFIAGDDCGCDERKESLNKIWAYKKVNCVTEEDYDYLVKFFNGKPRSTTKPQRVRLITIYNYVFNTNQNVDTNCTSCVIKIVNNLKKYLSVYK